jgi:hypothetical protein
VLSESNSPKKLIKKIEDTDQTPSVIMVNSVKSRQLFPTFGIFYFIDSSFWANFRLLRPLYHLDSAQGLLIAINSQSYLQFIITVPRLKYNSEEWFGFYYTSIGVNSLLVFFPFYTKHSLLNHFGQKN